MIPLEEPKGYHKNELRSLVPPRNTGFYTQTLKIFEFRLFACNLLLFESFYSPVNFLNMQ